MDTVLLTGGAGYIGLHLTFMLDKAGYQVIVLDNLSSGQNHPILKGKLIKGEVGDEKMLADIFKKYHISTIIHLAALTNVTDSIDAPLKYYKNNACQTIILLENAIKNQVKYFIFASSAAVFSHLSCHPIDEKQPTHPATPYGKAKQLIECMLRDCYTAYGLKSIIFRFFNVAGANPNINLIDPIKKWTQLIPLSLETAKGVQDHITIFGDQYETPDGTCIRDYIHVDDICLAHLLALKKFPVLDGCFTYHLGTGKGVSVKEVIQATEKITKKPLRRIIAPPRQSDSACVTANNKLARSTFDWTPQSSNLNVIIESFWKWLAHT